MFKGLMVKAAKSVWESTAPSGEPPEAPVSERAETATDESEAKPELTVAELGIDLPYEPGVGTACGDTCRCRWRVEVRWSADHNCNASFVTWVTASDKDVCPDCQERALEWQDVFIRPEISEG